jgi:hypothetical protein
MADLKKVAEEALTFNKNLNQVFVTTDGTAFVSKNDAVNHSRTFDDKTIAVFERGGDQNNTAADDEPKQALTAKATIELIEKAESEEAVISLLADDQRATVKAAAEKRIAELKQEALDAQAAAADEAAAQRAATAE